LRVSIVRDFFREDVDLNTALSQVTSLAMSDLYYLPPGTIPPMVMPFDPTASQPLCLISISSDTLDEAALYDVAYYELRNRLQSISGVIAPAVYGGKLRRIFAYVDPLKAQARNLSPLNVIEAIRNSNVMIPTGNAKIGDLDYQINANGMVGTVAEMNDLPLAIGSGPATYVRDVANVEDTSQIQTNVVRVNGKRQVYIPIYRQPGANTIAVVEGIKAQLEPIKERIKNVNLDVVMDQSVLVRESIDHLIMEAVIGAVLAALMVFIFLRSYRPMVIILTALPLSALGAFIGMFFSHQSMNVMTLGGLALVIGLLIDTSIVVLENIERHLAMGKSPYEAALDGTGEVTKPLIIVTLTICVVFAPIIFLTGIAKFLFTPMALSVICAIVTSLLLATTLVPVMAARLLKGKVHALSAEQRAALAEGKEPEEQTLGWFGAIQRSYRVVLARLLRVRWLVLIATAAVFAVSMLTFRTLGTELFPQTDSGQLAIQVRATTGLRIERTEELVAQIEKVIQEVVPKEERQILISNIGVLLDWPAAYTPNAGPSDAFILLQFADKKSRSVFDYADLLRQRLPGEFPEAEFSFNTGGILSSALNNGLPSPINIQVEGKDLAEATVIARKVVAAAKTVPGAVDVRIQQRYDAPQLDVEVDRVKAAQAGLTQEDIVKNIVTALNSSVNFAPSFWIDHRNGNHYFIGAQYREGDIVDFDTILDIPITGKNQQTALSLRNFASFKRSSAPSEITHLNITRVTDVFVNVKDRDVGAVAGDIDEALKGIRSSLPEGYRVQMRGEVQSMRESFASLGFGFGLAVVLVYLVMVVQFRSFRDPLIVMIAVPLGLIGVVWMLKLTDTYLSIQSAMGIIMMVGIVVSFSVLLVDFANRLMERDPNLTPFDAIVDAAGVRLRPILMTGLAAVLGLTPMAFYGGANIPLARAVVGGVIAAVVLVLFVVPPLYIIFKRRTSTPTSITAS
jgi:multidrug efflux pump subunit AcrB